MTRAPSLLLSALRLPALRLPALRLSALVLPGLLCLAAAGHAEGKKQDFRTQEPAWVLSGQTAHVELYGQDLKPTSIQFAEPGFAAHVVKIGPAAGSADEVRRRGNTVVEVEVTVPAACRPGYHPFRLMGEGIEPAEGKLLTDQAAPEIAETEPNDSLYKPQVLPPGSVTVTGVLNNEGVDVFRFDGKAGETWRVEIFARRLNRAVKFEPCLRLRGAHFAPVRAAVDQGDDCALEYQVPADGPYLIEVFDGDNRSGGDFKYRLALRKL